MFYHLSFPTFILLIFSLWFVLIFGKVFEVFCGCTYFQVDAQLQVVRKLEEKERLLQGTIGTAERELTLRTQALDMNKRKVTLSRVRPMLLFRTVFMF